MANITTNYLYTGKGPFDAKMLVSTYAELYAEGTFPSGSAYNGMLVAVGLNKDDPSKNGIYYLYDSSVTTKFKSPTTTTEANWHKLVELSEIDSIKERIDALEAKGDTPAGITKEELDAAIEALRTEITNAGYVTVEDLATKADKDHTHDEYALKSDIPDTSNFLTEIPEEYVTSEELTQAIEGIEIPEVNLDGYATQEWVGQQGYLTEHQDLSGKADKDHTHNIENIEGYDPSIFANAEEVNSKLNALEGKVDAIKVPTLVSELTNDAGYITSETLSSYTKAEDFNAYKESTTSDIASLNNTVASQATRLSDLETRASNHDQELSAIKPIVNKVEPLIDQVTSLESNISTVQSSIEELNTSLEGKVSIETFDEALGTKADVTALDAKADKETVNTALEGKADKNEVSTQLATKVDVETFNTLEATVNTKVDIDTYNTLAESVATKVDAHFVEEAIAELKIEEYAKTSEVTTAEQGEELYSKLGNVYTKSEVDTKIAEAISGGTVDLDGYVTEDSLAEKGFATETYVTDAIATKADAEHTHDYATAEDIEDAVSAIEIPDVSEFIKLSDVEAQGYLKELPAEAITETELSEMNFAVKSDLETLATTEQLAEKADSATTLSGYGITDAYTRTEVDVKLADLASGGSINLDGYVSEDEWNERVTTLATKEDVTAAVNAVKITYGEF